MSSNHTSLTDGIPSFIEQFMAVPPPLSKVEKLEMKVMLLEAELERLKKKDFICVNCLEPFCDPACKLLKLQELERIAYKILSGEIHPTLTINKKLFFLSDKVDLAKAVLMEIDLLRRGK